jgi:hypothetical protein
VRPFDRTMFGIERPTAEYPPLHPFVVAVAAGAGVHSVAGQRLYLALFGSAAAVVTALLARRLTGGNDVATAVAGGIAALSPLWFQSDATLMPETLTALLAAGVLLVAHQRPTTRTLLGLGALCGLAALARTDAGVLLLAVAVPTARRRAAIPIAAAALVVAPWVVRDAIRLDAFVPISTNAGSVLDGANCDATYGGPLLGSWSYGPDCFEGFLQDELAAAGEATVAAAHRDQGVDFATAHVTSWPKVAAARGLRTLGLWRPAQQADLARLEGRSQTAEAVGFAVLWASLALGAAAARAHPRVAAAVVAVWGTTLLSYGNPRFLAAAHPAIAALAGCGVVALASRRAGRSASTA